MLKKTLLVVVLFALAACGTKHVEEPSVELKREAPLRMMLLYKKPDKPVIRHEDKWFRYTLALNTLSAGQSYNVNAVFGQCKYYGGTYTVVDKVTGEVSRKEQISGGDCRTCHGR